MGVATRNAAVRRGATARQCDVSSLPTATNEHAMMVAENAFSRPNTPNSGNIDDVALYHAVRYRTVGLDAQQDDSTLAEHLAALHYSTKG